DMEAGIARAVEDVDCLRHDRSGRIDAARKLAAEAGRIDEIALEIDRHQGGRGRIELETPVGVAWNRMRHRPELPGRTRRTAIVAGWAGKTSGRPYPGSDVDGVPELLRIAPKLVTGAVHAAAAEREHVVVDRKDLEAFRLELTV